MLRNQMFVLCTVSQINSSQLIQASWSIQRLLNSIALHIFKGLWLRTRSSWQGHVSSATFSDLPCLFLFPLKFKRYEITGCERHCFTFQTTICWRVSTQMPLCPLVWCLNWLVLHGKKKLISRLPSTISLQQAQSAEPSTIKALSDCKPYRLPLKLKQPGMKHERPAYRGRETELRLWEWLWAEGALSEITFSFENIDLNKRLEEKVQKLFQVGMKAMLGRLKTLRNKSFNHLGTDTRIYIYIEKNLIVSITCYSN